MGPCFGAFLGGKNSAGRAKVIKLVASYELVTQKRQRYPVFLQLCLSFFCQDTVLAIEVLLELTLASNTPSLVLRVRVAASENMILDTCGFRTFKSFDFQHLTMGIHIHICQHVPQNSLQKDENHNSYGSKTKLQTAPSGCREVDPSFTPTLLPNRLVIGRFVLDQVLGDDPGRTREGSGVPVFLAGFSLPLADS